MEISCLSEALADFSEYGNTAPAIDP